MTDTASLQLQDLTPRSPLQVAMVGVDGKSVQRFDPSVEALLGAFSAGANIDGISLAPIELVPVRHASAIVVVAPHFRSGSRALSRLAAFVTRAKIVGKPVALLACSVGALRSPIDAALVRSIVKSSDLALLADEPSANVLEGLGVEPPFRMGADPAWTVLGDLVARSADDDGRVVVALGSHAPNGRTTSVTVAAVTALARCGFDVEIQLAPDANGAGSKTNRRFWNAVTPYASVVDAPTSLRVARERYAGARMVVTSDRHALMAAAAAGTRVTAIADSSRIERLVASLHITCIPAASDDAMLQRCFNESIEAEPVDVSLVRTHIDHAHGTIELARLMLDDPSYVLPTVQHHLPLYPKSWRS